MGCSVQRLRYERRLLGYKGAFGARDGRRRRAIPTLFGKGRVAWSLKQIVKKVGMPRSPRRRLRAGGHRGPKISGSVSRIQKRLQHLMLVSAL